jgi:hypothetical protein
MVWDALVGEEPGPHRTESGESRDRPGDEMVRLTVAGAADRLGISEAGVRKRVQRNQIVHERGEDGRLFVWISPGEARHAESRDRAAESRDESRSELVEELRDRLRFVERQLEAERQAHAEARRIIGGLVQRIPELEAPSEAPGRQESAAPGPSGGVPPEAERVPWWRRMFGG